MEQRIPVVVIKEISETDKILTALENYGKLTKAKEDLEKHYGEIAARKPVISVTWNLKESYTAGTRVKLPQATADANGTKLAVSVKVIFDGKILKVAPDGYYELNEKGDYKIVYTATNVYGETTEQEYAVKVN